MSGTTNGPVTKLHYAANGNVVNGVYQPGTDGFNLADVSSAAAADALPAGVEGLVWLGDTTGLNAAFESTVLAAASDPKVYGFYVADEPADSTAAALKAEDDFIHQNAPGKVAFIVLEDDGSPTSPSYGLTPSNTDADLIGLDPYPVRPPSEGSAFSSGINLSVIPDAVAEAEAVGWSLSQIVPVYQTFGGGDYTSYTLPTAAQEQEILSTWGQYVPTPAFDYAYSWGTQVGDTALVDDPSLQQVLLAHNTGTTSTAPSVGWSPASGSGVEGAVIALGTLAASGSSLTSVVVSGIPAGDTLSDGTHSFIAAAGSTSVNVLGWNDAALTIKAMNDISFTLSAQAVNAAGTSSAASEAVTVAPLAPTVAPVTVSGTVGQAIPLNLGLTVNGLAGDANTLASVTLSGIPSGAALRDSAGTLVVSGGSITFSASQLAAGALNGLAITPGAAGTFSLEVAAAEQDAPITTSATATGTEALNVSAPTTLPTVGWSPASGSGVEGAVIALGTLAASGSSLTSVVVSGIPAGDTLSDGTHSFIAAAGSTSVNVLGWNDAALTIKAMNDISFTLSAQAVNAAGTSSAASEAVTVAPLAPTVAPVTVSGAVGQAIPLNLGITVNGLSGDANTLASVTLSGIPSGAALRDSAGTLSVSGGSITFSASQLAAGALNGLAITPSAAGTFSLGVAAAEQDAPITTSATATGTEALSVTPSQTFSDAKMIATDNKGKTASISVITSGSLTYTGRLAGTVTQVFSSGTDGVSATTAITTESVTFGSQSLSMSFAGPQNLSVAGGSGVDTIVAHAGNNRFVAGTGTLTVTGGSGLDAYVFHKGDGLLTIEDFNLSNDTLTVDRYLRGMLAESPDSRGGVMLTFGTAGHGVDIANMTSFPVSSIHWG